MYTIVMDAKSGTNTPPGERINIQISLSLLVKLLGNCAQCLQLNSFIKLMLGTFLVSSSTSVVYAIYIYINVSTYWMHKSWAVVIAVAAKKKNNVNIALLSLFYCSKTIHFTQHEFAFCYFQKSFLVGFPWNLKIVGNINTLMMCNMTEKSWSVYSAFQNTIVLQGRNSGRMAQHSHHWRYSGRNRWWQSINFHSTYMAWFLICPNHTYP